MCCGPFSVDVLTLYFVKIYLMEDGGKYQPIALKKKTAMRIGISDQIN